MKKILMTFAAVFCCLMTMTVLIACSSNEDNPSGDPVMESGIVGSWCTDLTGRTFALWNYGPALNRLILRADGLCFGDRYVLSNIDEGYEQTTFHKLTNWGDWMRINEMHPHGNPTSQGGGPL